MKEKLANASLIRTSSNSSVKRLHALGLNHGKTKVVRRGLSIWPTRKSFTLHNPPELSLLCVGRLVEKKGYFLLIRILDLLQQRDKVDFQLKIVGGGPLRKPLQNEINRAGLYDSVELLGPKSEDEINKLYLESDVMLFTGIIASNGATYDRIRKKAQVEARERFDVNRTAQNLRKAFEQLLETNS